MNKKLIWGIIIVVILVAGGAYAYYESTWIKDPKVPTDENVVSTADWKTYMSEEYAYSIEYPSNWEISEGNRGGLNIISPRDRKLPNRPDAEFFFVNVLTYSGTSSDPVVWKKGNIVIGGQSFEKIIYEKEDGTHSFVRMINGGNQYLITLPQDDVETKIFESFKFTSPVSSKAPVQTVKAQPSIPPQVTPVAIPKSNSDVTLISPNGDKVLKVGSEEKITWKSTKKGALKGHIEFTYNNLSQCPSGFTCQPARERVDIPKVVLDKEMGEYNWIVRKAVDSTWIKVCLQFTDDQYDLECDSPDSELKFTN